MHRLALFVAFWGLIGTTTSGCAARTSARDDTTTFPVRGKVLFKGQPIGGARITFHSLPPGRISGNPFALTNSDGSFEVMTYRPNDGAPQGEFAVTVSWAPPRNPNVSEPEDGPERLPRRYQSPDQSGLRVAVQPKENLLAAFELKK